MNKFRTIACGLLLLSGVLAQAQTTNTWRGPSGNWSESTFPIWIFNIPRWAAPLTGTYATNVLQFNSWGSGYDTTNDLGTFPLHGLVFNNTSNSPTTISGGALSFTNNGASLAFIRIDNSGSATIANNVILASNLRLEGTGSGSVRLTGSLSGVGGLTVATSGSFELAGVNGFTGNTVINGGTLNLSGTGALGATPTINLNGGTLALLGAAANRINDSAAMIGNGGAFALNGLSESLGTFTLQSSSSIDFGAGAATLAFADSSGTTWSGGAVLSLYNWTEGSDSLVFGNSSAGLAGQLSQISFLNPGGYAPGTYAATILPNGEIVPVPEPAAWLLAAVGGLGLLARRRFA